MSRAIRPGRALVISHDAASGEGHARHDADEVTVLLLDDDRLPDVADFDQVLLVGIADPVRLAALVTALLTAPGTPEVLVGGGVAPSGSLDDWTEALGGIGIAGFDEGRLALAVVDRTGGGAGPVLYGLLAASLKESPRLVAPAREATAGVEEEPQKVQVAPPDPVPGGLRGQVARALATPRAAVRAGVIVAVIAAAVVAVLAALFGDPVIGALLGLILVMVAAGVVRAERRKTPGIPPQQLRRLEKLVERQSELLDAHSEQLTALRTSTSINELATIDIARSLVRDVS